MLGAATTLLMTGVAAANTFRAADLIYMPAVARAQGGGGAFFKTDIVISNLTSDRVTVDVVYMPTGAGNDNSGAINNFVTLPTLAPGERRVIDDFVAASNGLNRQDANGHLIFFACREGGNCACESGDCPDFRLISVTGRIYNDAPGGTFGQAFPGLPWYNYASIENTEFGYHRVVINGVRNVGSPGVSGYRTNIGLVNSSMFSATTLRLTMFNTQNQSVGQTDVTLAPLAHMQAPVTQFFSNFSGDGYVRVEQIAYTPRAGESDAVPGFFAYGSLIDNRTADPTTLEAIFERQLDLDCLFGSKPIRRGVNRN